MAKLNPGDKVPAFSLTATDGSTISSRDLKGQRYILYFYPKDLTPGCTIQACDFRDSSSLLKKRKVQVFGISKDSVTLHQKFTNKHELNFPLLSDEDGKVCKAFGVIKEKSLYGRKFMGIERTTFLIGKDGKIEKIYEKVKAKGHVEKLLQDL